VALLLLTGCQYLPINIKPPKPPFRMSPLKNEVTIQAAPGMGPAPFKVDQAQAGIVEVKLTLSNSTGAPIRMVWSDGTFISADSVSYAIGIKGGPDPRTQPSPGRTTIDAKKQAQVTVIAVGKDGKPVAPAVKSMEPPYRVGLKLTVETADKAWKGTVWVFVS
jgi:hypothetical protein